LGSERIVGNSETIPLFHNSRKCMVRRTTAREK
jgi:hypothetical protein